MKKIKVKPVEEIGIEFNDKELICTFNMMSMAYMQEEITKLSGNLSEISPDRMCSMVLYAGIKPNEPEFTLEEAIALALQLPPGAYSELMGMFNDAVYSSADPETKQIIKKIIAQNMSRAAN